MKNSSELHPSSIRLLRLISGFAFIAFTSSAAVPVVGLWRFNDGSGTVAADSSGFGNDGTLAGENGNVPAWVTGQPGFGGALRFTNNSVDHAYVTIPGNPSLKIGQTAADTWTITAWTYEDSGGTGTFVANYGRIMVIDNGEAFQFESGSSIFSDPQMYTWARANAQWQIPWGDSTPVAPLLDQWVHWAVVYDGANLTIYRNGNQGTQGGTMSAAVTAALGFAGYSGSMLIGSELAQPGDRTWNGMLDDVAVFAGALSEAEIRTVMTGDFSAHTGGPAHILTQPRSQIVPPGTDVQFDIVPQGLAPLRYQWYLNLTNPIARATNATLVLTNVQAANSAVYSISVSNSLGGEVSQPATLIVFTNKMLLVGLWRFNDAAGTNAIDSSGFGNNGILAGENGNVPKWTIGQRGFGAALRFTNDGADHAYVSVPGSDSLRIGQTATNPWSITAWAYEDSGGLGTFFATYGRIIVLDDGDAFQFESGIDTDPQMYTWARANAGWQIPWGDSTPVAPLLDQWVHWAVVYDGANLTLYRNGNQAPNGGVASAPVVSALSYAGYSGSVLIGSELAQPPDRNWNGMLDDVAVFNTALSAADVTTVMNGNFAPFITQPEVTVSASPGHVVLSWTAALPGFQLQSAPNLTSGPWTNVPIQPVTQGPVRTVTIPSAGAPQFFRLVSP